MPKLSSTALKARIDHLRKQLAAIETKKAPAIKKVRSIMKKLGVTIADVKGSSAPSKPRIFSAAKRQLHKRTVTVQYHAPAGAKFRLNSAMRKATLGLGAAKPRDD